MDFLLYKRSQASNVSYSMPWNFFAFDLTCHEQTANLLNLTGIAAEEFTVMLEVKINETYGQRSITRKCTVYEMSFGIDAV